MTVTSLVYTFAHVSGAQINCAVTWALVLNETISAAQGLANFFAQMLGSMIGAFFIQAATSPNWQRAEDINYGANALGNLQKDWHTTDDDGIAVTKITKGNAFTVEFLMTFLLVTVVLQTAVNRDSKAGAHAAIAIGFAVFLAHAVCIPLTGCSINPTRSFGPARLASPLFSPPPFLSCDRSFSSPPPPSGGRERLLEGPLAVVGRAASRQHRRVPRQQEAARPAGGGVRPEEARAGGHGGAVGRAGRDGGAVKNDEGASRKTRRDSAVSA